MITKNFLNENFKEIRATMHFYLPLEFHKNPPAQTDDLVEIERWVDTVVFYRAIGNYDENTDVMALWRKEFAILGRILVQAEESFLPYVAVTATFTRPGYGLLQRQEAIFMQWDYYSEEG